MCAAIAGRATPTSSKARRSTPASACSPSRGRNHEASSYLTDMTVYAMYATSEENKFIEVTYANGEKEVLYFKDFASGALIEGIVSRAKKFAVNRVIAQEGAGLRSDDLIRAIRE